MFGADTGIPALIRQYATSFHLDNLAAALHEAAAKRPGAAPHPKYLLGIVRRMQAEHPTGPPKELPAATGPAARANPREHRWLSTNELPPVKIRRASDGPPELPPEERPGPGACMKAFREAIGETAWTDHLRHMAAVNDRKKGRA